MQKPIKQQKNFKGYQNCCVKGPQKILGGRKPSLKLTLKTKWYRSYGCCDDSRSCEQLKKHITGKYFEIKVRLWTRITFR